MMTGSKEKTIIRTGTASTGIKYYDGTWQNKSAYDAAKTGGYTGTQADFYADLAAMKGLASALAAI